MPQNYWFEETPKKSKNRKAVSKSSPALTVTKDLAPLGEVMVTLLKIAVVCAAIALGVVVLVNIIKVIITAAFAIFLLVGFAASVGIDPVLVVVSDDHYWIEIDRWMD